MKLLNIFKKTVTKLSFQFKVKISELRMEILDTKSNRMSRANAGVFECNEFPDFLEALSNLLLRASYDADS